MSDSKRLRRGLRRALICCLMCSSITAGAAEKKPRPREIEVTYPPALPGGAQIVTDTSDEFLKPTTPLKDGVRIARAAPTIEFAYFPGQTYPGHPWSAWGDSLAVNGKYYASIGDHLAPRGNAFVYEYDPRTKQFRQLLDVRKLLNLPDGHYTPGKIHTRLDLGSDGWLYCATHRGSTKATTDATHYLGDWILRCRPDDGAAEIVVRGPVPKHCIPTGTLDPERLIFHGGTSPGNPKDETGIQFFAFDVPKRKVLYSGPNGPSRYMILASSTGRVYYTQGKEGQTEDGRLMRFDPAIGGPPTELEGSLGLRAATQETPQGKVYTVSHGGRDSDAILYEFDVKTETVRKLGDAAVGSQSYIASLDADPTGRFLYYVPGAHGGSDQDGSPIVRYDVQSGTKTVVAFLHPFYQKKYGCTPKGTYSLAVDPQGDTLYIAWNVSRGTRAWDCVALTVVHLPKE